MIEWLKKVIQRQAENNRCACGKRAKAKPQIPTGELKIYDNFIPFEKEEKITRTVKLTQYFICGICRKEHKLACLTTIPKEAKIE